MKERNYLEVGDFVERERGEERGCNKERVKESVMRRIGIRKKRKYVTQRMR